MKIKKYNIKIGDPWDYMSPSGEQNLITGHILKILENRCIVFEADYSLDFNGLKGKILVLLPRHENNFNNMKNVSINGGLYKNVAIVEDAKYMENNSEFFIIGMLE